MTFAGLPLTTLLGIGAVFGALTVALYVLRLRRRPVPVPFTRLWQRVLSDKQSSSLFSKLRQLLSLLLQLAMVAALVLALGDPRGQGHREEGRTFVVLLDASASMAAKDVLPSRFEQARQKVRELIEGMAAADRMLLVRMGATPAPLTTLTGDGALLKTALDGVRVHDTGADFDAALRLALDALHGQSRPEIVLVSDGALGALPPPGEAAGALPGEAAQGDASEEASAGGPVPQEPEPLRSPLLDDAAARGVHVSYLPVGSSGNNVAITQFAVRRYPLDKARHEVLLEITNTNDEPAEIELSLHGDGAIIDVQRLDLAGGEVWRRLYPDLGGASAELEARIRALDPSRDDLPADDRAYATLPERRRARVLLVTEGNTYLEAAVLLDEYLEVTVIDPADYPPPGSFDVTIFDGVAPRREARTGGALYLGFPERAGADTDFPLEHGAELEMFGFDHWDEKTPVLRWMTLPDIQVLTGRELVPRSGDRVLGSSESARGKRRPILVAGRREAGDFVALGFDPRRSDLVLRVAWPLFVLNVIDAFVEESGEALSAFRTGTVWRVPVPGLDPTRVAGEAKDRSATIPIRRPDGGIVDASVQEGHAVLFGEQAGFYEVRSEPPLRFAANLVSERESRIAPQPDLRVARSPAQASGDELMQAGPVEGLYAGTRREWWALLLLGVLGVSLVEWVTYHRRWTV